MLPQGTILGPILFSVMLNDIQAVDPDSSTLVKFADDLTLSVLVNWPGNPGPSSPRSAKHTQLGPRQPYDYKVY